MDTPLSGNPTSSSMPSPMRSDTLPDVGQIPAYQSFLAKARAFDDFIEKKSSRVRQLRKFLKPIDALTRTGPWPRAGALALGWSPLILAAPYIYLRFGFDAILFDSLLPASLLTAIMFWVVKALQKSAWNPIEAGSEYDEDLTKTISQLEETRLLHDAILRTRRTLYLADLRLLQAYNEQRHAEGQTLKG